MPIFHNQVLTIGHRNWNVIRAELEITSDYILRAKRESAAKIPFTMDLNQQGEARNNSDKYNKQLQGTIAQIYACELLKSWITDAELPDFEILRYDEVRTDGFRHPAGNYEIKIQKSSDNSIFEQVVARSSVFYNRPFIDAVRDFHIIGPYHNGVRLIDDYVKFYLRPMYNFTQDYTRHSNFVDFLDNNYVELYFVAGCLEDLMRTGQIIDMRQNGTRYQAILHTDGSDMVAFQRQFIDYLQAL